MDKIFLIKVIISFIIGSIWITGSTYIAERYGTKLGGVVVGLPSTIIFGLLFIGWTQSVEVAVEATDIVPFMGGINSIFLVVYMYLLRFNFWVSLIGAFSVWGVLAFLLIFLNIKNFLISILTYIVLFLFSYYIVEKKLNISSEKGKSVVFKPFSFFIRGVICGLIVSSTVVLAKIGGPVIGGIFTMFPAMFLGTMLVTYFSHGPFFSSAVMKSSLIGAVSVVIYGITARFVMIPFGLWFGTLFSLLVSYLCALVINKFIIKKIT